MYSGEQVATEETAFMLAEYSTLRELRESSVRLGENRVSSFLTVISAAIVGVGIASNNGSGNAFVSDLTVIVVTGLVLLGLNIFVRVIEREIAIIEYTRGMNRVRAYFAERHEHLRPFLFLPIDDSVPPFGAFGNLAHGSRRAAGLSGAVGLINAFLFALATACLVSATDVSADLTKLTVAGCVGFAVLAVAEAGYYALRMRNRDSAFQATARGFRSR